MDAACTELLRALHEALDTPPRIAYTDRDDQRTALIERCAALRGVLTSVLRHSNAEGAADTIREIVAEQDRDQAVRP